MLKYLLIVLFLYTSLISDISLNDIKKYPISYARDFFIYLYLKQDSISEDNANIAKSLVSKDNYKIQKQWLKHTTDEDELYQQKCKSTSKLADIKDIECLALAFSTQRVFRYINDRKILRELEDKLKDKYPKKSKIIYALSHRNFINYLLKNNPTLFIDIFNSINTSTRKKYFDKSLSYKNVKDLSKNKYKFSKMIQTIVTTLSLHKLQKSFLKLNIELNLFAKSYFFLGVNAIRYNKNKLAIYYFSQSHVLCKNIEDKNKSLFWLYKTTQDKKYLYTLAQSYFVDIYSTYALNRLGLKPDIISTINTNKDIKKPLFDASNPFDYIKYKQNIKKFMNNGMFLDKRLLHKDTISFLLPEYNKLFKFKKNFFLIPDYIRYIDIDIEEKAMILSIARQESNFIPSSISSSFAIGVMQIMPFVSEEIAQRAKYKYTPWNMFDAKVNVKFAVFHLKGLKRHLKHPLFMAYGYSNGMGYTKRMLKKEYFNIKNKFDPWLSMELIKNNQARKYGKKVLGNYIIYMSLLKRDLNIDRLFNKIQYKLDK
jgi:soluble lytic murein transglycosylase